MKYVVALGRLFYSLIFLFSGVFHFSSQTVMYAAAQGVPLPTITVPLSGVIAILGGISVAIGYRAKWGALLLVLFLAPVTVMMHNFWGVTDPLVSQMQLVMFMKNMGLLGAALLISYFGPGPLSLDARTTSTPPEGALFPGHRLAA